LKVTAIQDIEQIFTSFNNPEATLGGGGDGCGLKERGYQ
jgi:hypothetical protein